MNSIDISSALPEDLHLAGDTLSYLLYVGRWG
jgi:hypothetical protein